MSPSIFFDAMEIEENNIAYDSDIIESTFDYYIHAESLKELIGEIKETINYFHKDEINC